MGLAVLANRIRKPPILRTRPPLLRPRRQWPSCHAPKPRDEAAFDHLVGAKQDRWGYGKTERLGGLEVQDHLVFRWKLNGEIRRLGAA
jgi:hypothetical protein